MSSKRTISEDTDRNLAYFRTIANSVSLSGRSLRFRIRRGIYEIELDGDFDYVREKFEELIRRFNIGISENQQQPQRRRDGE